MKLALEENTLQGFTKEGIEKCSGDTVSAVKKARHETCEALRHVSLNKQGHSLFPLSTVQNKDDR